MKAFFAYLRRHFGWSTSRGSWYERLGAAVLLVAGAGGWWLSDGWSIEGRLLLAALWLAMLAVLVRHEIVRLVGPVFFFEVLRGTRRRVHAIRVIYAGILLVLITYVYFVMVETESTYRPELQTQARLAATFFSAFFGVQMLLICLA